MSFVRFTEDDIIDSFVLAHPRHEVELNGDQVTGSIYLEKQYLNSAIETRLVEGFSAKDGGIVQKTSPFTASVDIVDAVDGGTNKQLYRSIINLYDHYDLINTDYATAATTLRVITIPEIYYDSGVLSGTFSASDRDSSGDLREVFDNGRGGLYSGSLSGTLIGNIFYNEGFAVLTKADLNDFGVASSTNFKWQVNFEGIHKIPVKIFRCRAPSGQFNASTNDTYYHTPTASADFVNEKNIVLEDRTTYITTIGLFNEQYELIGLAQTAQPIKKEESQDLLFRLRLDF